MHDLPPALGRGIKLYNWEQKTCDDYKAKNSIYDIRCTMGGTTMGAIRSTKNGACYVLRIDERETNPIEYEFDKIWRFWPTTHLEAPALWQWEPQYWYWVLKDSTGKNGRVLARFEHTALVFEERCGLSDATRREVLLTAIAMADCKAQDFRDLERGPARNRANPVGKVKVSRELLYWEAFLNPPNRGNNLYDICRGA